ncbi:MAG: DNA-directed RNA polymerase subunit A' [archaeon]|jgi:DNA-directed RNA polymerase subunit A'
MNTSKKIRSIEFGVLSPEMIRKMSAVEISRADTYDKDGYPIERGLMDPHLGIISPGLRCKTCGQTMKGCPGHFGALELIRPVVHPKFGEKLYYVLTSTCQHCGRLLLDDEEVNDLMLISEDTDKTVKEILARVKGTKKCPHCKTPVDKIALDKPTNYFKNGERLYPAEILDWLVKVPDKDLFLFGYSDKLKPQWFILSVLPISPVSIRPSLSLENVITSEDDLTYKLLDIVRINIRLQENINAGAPQIIIEDLWDLLQYNITTYIDNNTAGVPPAKQRSGRPLKTIAQRLKGKKGRFRYNLIGKRVNASARSTITPSTEIKFNELGIPEFVANTLTVPEKVTTWNKEKIKEQILKGKISYILSEKGLRKIVTPENCEELAGLLAEGMTAKRKLQDGDIVIFNRQPTLHRISMMGHYAKILPGRTFRLNPICCDPYNADFDGDDMNLHVPQSEESYTEVKELMIADKHVISVRNGKPVITPDHDLISGAYLLTRTKTEFTRKEAMEMLYSIGITELPVADRGRGNYSGKLIFSQILPKGLTIEYNNKMCSIVAKAKECKKKCKKEKCAYDCYMKIENGKLVTGVIDEKIGSHKGLIETIYRHFGIQILIDFYYKFSKLVFYAIAKQGLTVALDEYNASEDLKKEIKSKIKGMIASSNAIIKKYEDRTLPLTPGKDLEETFENEILKITGEMKDKVSDKILEIKLDELFSETKKANNNAILIASIGGSRGRVLNVVNMTGLWGQVTVRTGRPKSGYADRLLSISPKGTNQLTDYGFVQSNFFDGMNAREYFCHAIGGRQGEIDTGVATKVSGYLYRRLSNALKDLVVNDELKVTTADGQIIQYLYGEDGLSPEKAYLGKNINFFNE